MKQGDKHHYIPKFYLKQWAAADRRVCEYSKPHQEVIARTKFPDATGYARGLYTFPNLPNQAKGFIEQQLLLNADNLASKALERLLVDDVEFDGPTKSAWSRFLMSLIQRNPERIAQLRMMVESNFPNYIESIRHTWESIRHPDDTRSYEEVKSGLSIVDIEHVNIRLLQLAIDSAPVGTELNKMIFGTIRFLRLRYPLLTSDRPLIMTNGIKYPNSHIVMPISPDRVFFAAKSDKVAQDIDRIFKQECSGEKLNDLIVRQARKYVYGNSGRQLRFVANRFGHAIKSTPFE